jgi:hypothetical protein
MVDLAREFNELINNEGGFGVGHWVLLRHFTSVINEDYYNEAYKEAIGGPKYEFVDIVIRAYSAPGAYGMALAADGKTRVEPVDIPTQSIIYYTQSDAIIAKEDLIFELDWNKKERPTVVYTVEEEDIDNWIVRPKRKAEVLKVVNYSSDTAGETEYRKIFTEEHSL